MPRHTLRWGVVALTPLVAAGILAAPARADQTPSAPAADGTPVVVAYTVTGEDGRPEVERAVAADATQAQSLVRALGSVPGVQAASVTVPMHRMAVDPLVPSQWGLGTLGWSQAIRYSTGSGVTVAVIDDGVDRTHPDLASGVLPGRNMADPGKPVDPGLHGTHVAGIIAARSGNGIGGAGMAPRASILPIDVFHLDYADDATVAAGIYWAVKQPGVRVINMSLGGPDSTAVLRKAVAYAISEGVVVVAAAGNDGGPILSYPAAYPGVLGVGAVDARQRLAYFSDTGRHVDLVAPGMSIVSTTCRLDPPYPASPTRAGQLASIMVCPAAYASRSYSGTPAVVHNYATMDGTSMATPFVAGVAALVAARFPSWSGARITSMLLQTARDLGPAGRDDSYGYGLVNPVAVLTGVPGVTTGVSVYSNPDAGTVNVRWKPVSHTGSYGIAAWQVEYRVDGGTWTGARSLPYSTNSCTVTLCSTTFTVPTGHVVRARVVAVANRTGVLGAARYAGVFHGAHAGSTPATALPLTTAAPYTGVLLSGTDESWLRIEAPHTGTSFTVAASGAVDTLQLAVYDSADTSTPIVTGSPTDGVTVSVAGPNAVYYVRLTGGGAPLAPFAVSLAYQP